MGFETTSRTTVLPSAGSPQRSLLSTTMEISGMLTGVGISDTGTQRNDNQDAYRMAGPSAEDSRLHALFAVADGMGGLAQGRFASHVALQVFFKSYFRKRPSQPEGALRTAMEEAHFGLQQAMQKLGIPRMGTTLTAACVEGTRLYLAHIGDSRAYLLRGGRAECLTHDHTTAGELVRMQNPRAGEGPRPRPPLGADQGTGAWFVHPAGYHPPESARGRPDSAVHRWSLVGGGRRGDCGVILRARIPAGVRPRPGRSGAGARQ